MFSVITITPGIKVTVPNVCEFTTPTTIDIFNDEFYDKIIEALRIYGVTDYTVVGYVLTPIPPPEEPYWINRSEEGQPYGVAVLGADAKILLSEVPLGESGYSGYSGISGYSGLAGISGYSGISGISGYSGISGTDAITYPHLIPGCILWLRSDLGITKDGSNLVSTWSDLSLRGNNATQPTGANKPLWVDNQLNGFPCIRFDGIASYLMADAISTYFSLSHTPWSYLAVFKRNTIAVQGIMSMNEVAGTGGNQDGVHFCLLISGNFYHAISFDSDQSQWHFTDSDTNYDYYVANYNGSKITTSKNGSIVLNNASPNRVTGEYTYAPNNFHIGDVGYTGENNFASMDLFEIALYNNSISASDRTRLNNYVYSTYGL